MSIYRISRQLQVANACFVKKEGSGKGIAIEAGVWYDIGHGVIVLQGGGLPNSKEKGGGADGIIRSA